MATGGSIEDHLQRPNLPAGFERWRVTLRPGETRPTSGREWAGAMVLVEQGTLEVACLAGGSRAFCEGDLLILGLLPLRSLHNRGDGEVRLLAVRRAGHRPSDPFLQIFRHHRRAGCDESGAPRWSPLT